MLSTLIQLSFDKIMQTKTYTAIILRTEEKRFAIYTEPVMGKNVQQALTNKKKIRPYTHDLINLIFNGLNITIKQIVINDLEGTTYFARLFFEQKLDGNITHIVEVDARPSDCLMLAITNNVPIYCTREVLEKTIVIEDE